MGSVSEHDGLKQTGPPHRPPAITLKQWVRTCCACSVAHDVPPRLMVDRGSPKRVHYWSLLHTLGGSAHGRGFVGTFADHAPTSVLHDDRRRRAVNSAANEIVLAAS